MTDESNLSRYDVPPPAKPPYYPIERVVVRDGSVMAKLIEKAFIEGPDENTGSEPGQLIDLEQWRNRQT